MSARAVAETRRRGTHTFECAKGHLWSSGNRLHHPTEKSDCPRCGGACVEVTCPDGCKGLKRPRREKHTYECRKGHKWRAVPRPILDVRCPRCGGLAFKVTPRKRTLAEIAKLFSSVSSVPEPKRQECMLYVGWSGLNDPGDDGTGHHRMRDRVTADLGLDRVPDPPFTAEEMQIITYAAKMQALKCLRARAERIRKGGR